MQIVRILRAIKLTFILKQQLANFTTRFHMSNAQEKLYILAVTFVSHLNKYVSLVNQKFKIQNLTQLFSNDSFANMLSYSLML